MPWFPSQDNIMMHVLLLSVPQNLQLYFSECWDASIVRPAWGEIPLILAIWPGRIVYLQSSGLIGDSDLGWLSLFWIFDLVWNNFWVFALGQPDIGRAIHCWQNRRWVGLELTLILIQSRPSTDSRLSAWQCTPQCSAHSAPLTKHNQPHLHTVNFNTSKLCYSLAFLFSSYPISGVARLSRIFLSFDWPKLRIE